MAEKDHWKYPGADCPGLPEATPGSGFLSHAEVDVGSVGSRQQCLGVPGLLGQEQLCSNDPTSRVPGGCEAIQEE